MMVEEEVGVWDAAPARAIMAALAERERGVVEQRQRKRMVCERGDGESSRAGGVADDAGPLRPPG